MVPTVTLTGVGVLGRAQSFDDVKLGAPVLLLLLLFFFFVLFLLLCGIKTDNIVNS